MQENLQERYDYWQKVMEEFERSGMTQGKFCELHHYPLRQFKYYRQYLKGNLKTNGPKPAEFMAVKLQASEVNVVGACALPELAQAHYTISLPNGIRLEIPISYHKASLQGLLEVLCQC